MRGRKGLIISLIFLWPRLSAAAVKPIVLHIDTPKAGIEINEILDISQVVSIGEPQVLPASGLMLYPDEMAGTMADIHSLIQDYGPLLLRVDDLEPKLIAVPMDYTNMFLIDPGLSVWRYSKEDRLRLTKLAERAEHLGVLIMLEWLRLGK